VSTSTKDLSDMSIDIYGTFMGSASTGCEQLAKRTQVGNSLLVLLAIHTDDLVLSILINDECGELSTFDAGRVETFGVFIDIETSF